MAGRFHNLLPPKTYGHFAARPGALCFANRFPGSETKHIRFVLVPKNLVANSLILCLTPPSELTTRLLSGPAAFSNHALPESLE